MKDFSQLPPASQAGLDGGQWYIKHQGVVLTVIASWGMDWDHVSVSLPTRTPCYDEMSHIKRLFFKDSECAMELHVPIKAHISNHPYCLHLWRPHKVEIPQPPTIMV